MWTMKVSKQPSRIESLTTLCKRHAISLVYLFGSQAAAGHAYFQGISAEPISRSDLDIGLVFDTLPASRMQVYGQIYEGVSSIFAPFSIDPVFLQETDYLFQFEAIKGKLIYAVSEATLDAYEDRVLKFASDIAFYLPLFQQEVMEAIENGYFQIE